jgi:HSP20 family protein
MTESEAKALQAKDKSEVSSMTEQTKPGLVFTPDVDIFETEKGLTLLADIPGVKSEDLNIDLKENVLTLDGDVKKPESTNEVELFTEYRTGKYYRQFNLSEIIDQSKIEATMTDGVLRLTLPKVEAAKPRRITIKSS